MKVLSLWALSLSLLLSLSLTAQGQGAPESEIPYKSNAMVKGLCWSGASVICFAAACSLTFNAKGKIKSAGGKHLWASMVNGMKNIPKVILRRKRDPNIQQDLETLFEFLKIGAGPICCLVVAYITALKAYEEFSHVYHYNKQQEHKRKANINTIAETL